jgi:hypothetical protein
LEDVTILRLFDGERTLHYPDRLNILTKPLVEEKGGF